MLEILIVEDSVERKELFRCVYEKHHLVIVDNVDAALRELNSRRFDLISLDYDLVDGRTGAEVAEHLATDDSLDAAVLVHSQNPDGVRAISAAFPGVIEFPAAAMERHNSSYARLKAELASGQRVDWVFVLEGQRKISEDGSPCAGVG